MWLVMSFLSSRSQIVSDGWNANLVQLPRNWSRVTEEKFEWTDAVFRLSLTRFLQFQRWFNEKNGSRGAERLRTKHAISRKPWTNIFFDGPDKAAFSSCYLKTKAKWSVEIFIFYFFCTWNRQVTDYLSCRSRTFTAKLWRFAETIYIYIATTQLNFRHKAPKPSCWFVVMTNLSRFY